MTDKRLIFGGFLGGIGFGLFLLSWSTVAYTVHEFSEGLFEGLAQPDSSQVPTDELLANRASISLTAPLKLEQNEELFQGLVFLLHDQYSIAVSVLGKYALLGDKSAQSAIGSMYYFGKGLPVNREEGLRWLRLAAAQGGRAENETLEAAWNGTLEWDRRETDSVSVSQESPLPDPQYGVSAPPGQALAESRAIYDQAVGRAMQSRSSMGALSSIDQAYGSAPASRYSETQIGPPPAASASPLFLNRAGPGTYSDRNGDIYTQAGPHGVINTRTGEFSPTN